MEPQTEIQGRIFAAADSLYQHGGLGAFPTVDAVRKSAHVNMNDASVGMRLWRRAQKQMAVPEASAVPEGVQRASMAALVVLWRDAQLVANESFQSSRAGWEAERAETDESHRQLADAFEAQAAELRAAIAKTDDLTGQAEKLRIMSERVQAQLAAVREEALTAHAAERVSEARASEIGMRAADLREELNQAYREMTRLRTDMERLNKVHAAEASKLADTEAAAARKAAEDLAVALAETREARESAAALRGEVGALQAQHAALLRRLSPSASS